MARMESRIGYAEEGASERTVMLVLTLLVTTLIVGFAAFVLGSAMSGAGGGSYGHRAAIAAPHQPA
jgi:hypothetical protein